MEVGFVHVLGEYSQKGKNIKEWIEAHYHDTKLYLNGNIDVDQYLNKNYTGLAELGFLVKKEEIGIIDYLIDTVNAVVFNYEGNDIYKPVKLSDSNIIYDCKSMRDDIIYHNATLGYQPISPQYGFMTNFKVDWDGVKNIKLDDNVNESAVRNNNISGQAKLFHNSIIERGARPFEALMSLIVSYICDDCRYKSESNKQCLCWKNSASLVSIIRLCKKGAGMPFYYRTKKFYNGKQDTSLCKSERYEYIPSILPILTYSLLELAIREYTSAVDKLFEIHIINNWLESNYTFCFDIINKFKKQKKCAEIFRKTGKYIVPEFDADFNFTGFHTDIGEGTTAAFNDFGVEKIFKDSAIGLSDNKSRFMAYTVSYMSPSVLVRGSIELIIGASAQGTNPKMGMSQQVKTSYDMGVGQTIPRSFRYNDLDMEGVRAVMYEQIRKNPPNLDKIESSFLESATTNSAGLSRDEIREQITHYTEHADALDQKLLPYLIGIRIFDVLNVILEDLVNIESFRNALNSESSAGLRYQVDRRIRLIQMLRSIFMCGPFIIKYVLEPSILNSDVAATGKTTNDIRDAYNTIVGTTTSNAVNSKDIAGMDTGTHKAQTSFVTEAVLDYLQELRYKGHTFFLDTPYVNVTVMNDVGDTWEEKISILEWIVMYENYASNRPRIYRGGYFCNKIVSSNIAFESGSYKTSIQHTFLLVCIFIYVIRLYMVKYAEYGLKIIASVLGDDMFEYMNGVGAKKTIQEVNKEFNDDLTKMLEKFGYIAEDVFEIGFGEFLKQAALFGVPMPYGNRLCVFSSERRDNGTLFDRVKNIFGVLDELGTRVPRPEYTVNIKMILPHIMGILSVNSDPLAYANREYGITVDKLIKSGMIVYKYDDTRYLYTGRPLWPHLVNVATPLPRTKTSPRTSFMGFSSPAYCRRICQLIRNSNTELMNGTYNGGSVKRYIAKTPELLKRYWNSVLKTYSERYVQMQWKNYPQMIPKKLIELVDAQKVEYYGLLDGFLIYRGVQISMPDIELGPKFKRYQQFGNSLLDKQKAAKSFFATRTLLTAGVKVPSDVTYYNRVGARLISVAKTATVDQLKRFSNGRVLSLCKFRSSILLEYLETISYGIYDISFSEGKTSHLAYDVIKNGFGPCVPPNSTQSLLIATLGLPSPRASEIDTVKYGIQSSILIDGVSDSVLRALNLSFDKMGSRGVELMMDAIGMAPKLKQRVWQLIADLGIETLSIPYAINPRKCYYYGTSYTDKNNGNFRMANIRYIPRRLQWAIYVSEVCYDPSASIQSLQLVLGS